jgi:apolipoprotein N-acyltransferase
LVVIYQGAFFAMFALVFWGIKKRIGLPAALLSAPFVWTFLEFITTFGIFGIPELIGHSQIFNPLLRTAAPLLGVSYMTFLTVLLNSLLTLSLLSWRTERKTVLWLSGLFLLLIATNYLLSLGTRKILSQSAGRPVTIALAQPLMPPALLNDPGAGREVYSAYLNETRNILFRTTPPLIIWPEMVFPFTTNEEGPSRDLLTDLMKSYHGQILLGGPETLYDAAGEDIFHNAAFLFSKGEVVDLYQKERLFPFGEYIPYRPFFCLIERYLPLKLLKT